MYTLHKINYSLYLIIQNKLKTGHFLVMSLI